MLLFSPHHNFQISSNKSGSRFSMQNQLQLWTHACYNLQKPKSVAIIASHQEYVILKFRMCLTRRHHAFLSHEIMIQNNPCLARTLKMKCSNNAPPAPKKVSVPPLRVLGKSAALPLQAKRPIQKAGATMETPEN